MVKLLLLFLYFFQFSANLAQLTSVQAQSAEYSLLPITQSSQDHPLVFVEDFSQGLSQWQLNRGDMDDWQIVNGKLQAKIERPFKISELLPTDQAWNQEWKHYQLQFDYKVIEAYDKNWSWGYQAPTDWYEFHFQDYYWHLVHLLQGYENLNRSGTYELNPNQTYRVTINFNQGWIQAFVNDTELIQVKDPVYEPGHEGKISLKATTGTRFPTQVEFDNIKVYLLDNQEQGDFSLSVPQFKQHDERWKDFEYDQASSWSEQVSVQRWGCALTSLAMVFNYHQLNSFPQSLFQFPQQVCLKTAMPFGNDCWLTPASLNYWLQHQADGYVGRGALNWIAATRLAKILSEASGNNLPKLEYQRFTGTQLEPIIDVLQQHRPAILQLPGHFLVAAGFTNQQDDLLIKDPAYIFTKLSQHEEPLLSTIDLVPSQTDLSYLMLVYADNLVVDIWQLGPDQTLEPVENTVLVQDSLLDFVEQTELFSAKVKQLLPKPQSGNYFFTVRLKEAPVENPTNLASQIAQLQIFSYDQQAEFKQFNSFAPVKTEPNLDHSQPAFKLSYGHQDLALVKLEPQKSLDLSCFQSKLDQGLAGQQLPYYFYWLEQQIAQSGQLNQDQVNRSRVEQYLLKLIKQYQAKIDDVFKAELLSCWQ